MLIAYQDATKTTKAQLVARNVQLVNTILKMYLVEIHRRSVKSVSLLCVIFQSSHYDFTFLTIRFVIIYSLCLLSTFLFSFSSGSIGYYQTSSGSTFCLPCSTGTYQNKTGSSGCTECPKGYSNSATNAQNCTEWYVVMK